MGYGIPSRRILGLVKWIGQSLLALVVLATLSYGFVLLHMKTFVGEMMPVWTHGPFDMDHGNYLEFTRARDFSHIRYLDKANKHPLTAVVYWLVGESAERYGKNQAAPSSLLVGLAILLFGLWLRSRTDLIYAIVGIVCLGSSFAVWFNGAVLETRSAIFLGAVILLIGIDLVNRRPGPWSAVGASLLTIPLLGFSVPNLFLLPLVPLIFLLKAAKLGLVRALKMALLYSGLVFILVVFGFHCMTRLNPGISLRAFCEVSELESGKVTRCEISHFTTENFKMTARQYLFCSLAGLLKPPTPEPGRLGAVKDSAWLKPELFRMYLETMSGALFLITYLLVVAFLAVSTIRTGYRGHILWVLLAWIGIDIFFLTYFDPWARSPWGVEITVPIWAIIVCGLFRLRKRWLWLWPLLLGLALLWHNSTVMHYLRELY